MAQTVAFNGNSGLTAADWEKVAKYAAGMELIAHKENPMDGMSSCLLFSIPEMLRCANYARQNGFKTTYRQDINIIKSNWTAEKKMLGNGGWQNTENWQAVCANGRKAETNLAQKMAQQKFQNAETAVGNGKYKLFDRIKAFFQGKDAKVIAEARVDRLGKAADEAAKTAKDAATKASTLTKDVQKTAAVAKKGTTTKAAATVATTSTEATLEEAASFGSKALKFLKGNILTTAISGAMELFSSVIPTFEKYGAGRGIKQLGKSVLNVGADVTGFAIGSAIGGAIGSVLPIAGTAVGAVVGGILGMAFGSLFSWAGRKLVEATAGKSELDLGAEEDAEQQAQKAPTDQTTAQDILTRAQQRLALEGADSDNAKAVVASLGKLTGAAGNTGTTVASTTSQSANASLYQLPTFKAKSHTAEDLRYGDFMAMGTGLA